MSNNRLLEFWLELTNLSPRTAKYFTNDDNNQPIVHIERIKSLAKRDVLNNEFGYPNFVELFVNSYVNELLEKLPLQRGFYESGPHPVWGGNWVYQRHLEPGVAINSDFDNQKDNIKMALRLPENLKDKVMHETHLFMEKARILRVESPANFYF